MFDRPGPHRDYATLLASAESGDADAAYEMATKLAACQVVKSELSDTEKVRRKRRPLRPDELRARKFRRYVPRHALEGSHIQAWLERAAVAGSVPARVEVLRRFMLNLRRDAAWASGGVDEQAMAYVRTVEHAALHGHPDALNTMSVICLWSYFGPFDVIRAYAYCAARHVIVCGTKWGWIIGTMCNRGLGD